MGIRRPKCEWAAGNCERPATWIVGFVQSGRFRLSCKDHLDDWHKNGAGYWSADLRGFVGDMDHVTGDILRDDQRDAEARKVRALR